MFTLSETGVHLMKPFTDSSTDREELLLRTSRRSLMIVLAMVLLAAATLIAHVLRPGTLLADWASKAPWLIPVGIVFVTLNAPIGRRIRPDAPEVKAMLADEFRQANLARAQRLSLIFVVIAQIPLAILLSGLASGAAVTVMGVASVTVAMTTLITSFLYFDRE
jgi:hypothetical protein